MPQSKVFLQPREALTKNLCHAQWTSAVKWVGGALSESVKKGKFMKKSFFQIMLYEALKISDK